MTTKPKRKPPAMRTKTCEACGRGFQTVSGKAKACTDSCRNLITDMGQRARVLGGLGIEIKDGLSDAGVPTIFYKVPIDSWPFVEVAATKRGISADAYLDGWVRFARRRMMRKANADQQAAMLND